MNGPAAAQVSAAFTSPEKNPLQRSNVIFFFLQFNHTIGKSPQNKAKSKIREDNMLMYLNVTKINSCFPK